MAFSIKCMIAILLGICLNITSCIVINDIEKGKDITSLDYLTSDWIGDPNCEISETRDCLLIGRSGENYNTRGNIDILKVWLSLSDEISYPFDDMNKTEMAIKMRLDLRESPIITNDWFSRFFIWLAKLKICIRFDDALYPQLFGCGSFPSDIFIQVPTTSQISVFKTNKRAFMNGISPRICQGMCLRSILTSGQKTCGNICGIFSIIDNQIEISIYERIFDLDFAIRDSPKGFSFSISIDSQDVLPEEDLKQIYIAPRVPDDIYNPPLRPDILLEPSPVEPCSCLCADGSLPTNLQDAIIQIEGGKCSNEGTVIILLSVLISIIIALLIGLLCYLLIKYACEKVEIP